MENGDAFNLAFKSTFKIKDNWSVCYLIYFDIYCAREADAILVILYVVKALHTFLT